MSELNHLPELLCPAGDSDAFDAAIEAGADAIYLGGTSFNARMNAHNFDENALRLAVDKAHRFGIKVYQTLNTLVYDKEQKDFLKAGELSADCGIDALIVADIGSADLLHRHIPTLELHASTQMSAHNASFGEYLFKKGYSRMVIARECSYRDMKEIVQKSPIEVEAFIHGALCVSHSGQCLFSSVVGGRSGNRGECAQPCRLPYNGKNNYPLSLKDLCLADHLTELLDTGVHSLKIEGRMKSADYVYRVTKIWRKLLDERRNATEDEMRMLAEIFSRNGFTDGYFEEKISHSMLGIRTEQQKTTTKELNLFNGLTRTIPLTLDAKIRSDEPMLLSVSDGRKTVTVTGDIPYPAQKTPTTKEDVTKSLSKLGGTVYSLQSVSVSMDENLMIPLSKINELRRKALSALCDKIVHPLQPTAPNQSVKPKEAKRTARFYTPSQITNRAKEFFEERYLPLWNYHPDASGVVLPPVIFPHEEEAIRKLLNDAKEKGCRSVLVGNRGHFHLIKDLGFRIFGDFRLNVTNCESQFQAEADGCTDVLLSPELTLPQMRDIKGNTSVIVYGRLPLMTTEKCLGKEIGGCNQCLSNHNTLIDRRNVSFPVLREWEHRSVVYNSLPTWMGDRQSELSRYGMENRHFIFTVETPEEVDDIIKAYKKGTELGIPVRRIQ